MTNTKRISKRLIGAIAPVAALACLFVGREARAETIVNVSTISALKSAITTAGPGTTIVLADGTYKVNGVMETILPGTSSGRITVKAAHANAAIIETNAYEEAFRVTKPYWTFRDLFIRVNGNSTYGYKLEGDGHHTQIINGKIEIRPGSEAGVKGAGSPNAPWPGYALIEGVEIYMTAPTTYGLAEGIDAVAVYGWTIRNNVIHDIRTSAGGVAYGIMTKGNSQNSLIERNLVYNCFIGISLGGGGTASQWMRNGDGTYEDRNGTIRNNIVSTSKDVSIYLYKSNGSKVYNNTLWSSYTNCGTGCSSIDVRLAGATADTKNNILDKPILNREGGTHTASGNMQLPSTAHTGWFVNAASRDFHLVSTAPAVNRGVTISSVTNDKYNKARSGTYDVGAAER